MVLKPQLYVDKLHNMYYSYLLLNFDIILKKACLLVLLLLFN